MAEELVDTNDNGAPAQAQADRRWMLWLALLIVLLVALWLLRDYFARSDAELDDGQTITTSSQLPIAPAVPEPEVSESREELEDRVAVGVPDVVGLMTSDAVGTLDRAGYSAEVTKVFSTDRARGVVFEQVPSAGSLVEAGSTVRLLVSDGSGSADSVTVPDFIGMKRSAAVDKAEASGLDPKVMVQQRPDGEGRVFQQSPEAGTALARGTKVFLLVIERGRP